VSSERIIGAVLAGGRSRRFGRDKALVRLRGRSLLTRALESLAPYAEERYLIAKTPGSYAAPGITPLTDRYAAASPLSGILTVAERLEAGDWLLLTACDIVVLWPGLIDRLFEEALSPGRTVREAALFSLEGRLQPFPGLYPAELLGYYRRAYAEGRMELTRIAAEMPHREASLERQDRGAAELPPLANINRPEELERIEMLLETRERSEH
jgi:molybdopterin-guanine dinucleotide biosynthesis protein A